MSNTKFLKPQPHHTPAKTFVLTEEDFAEAAKDYRKAALVSGNVSKYAQGMLQLANMYGVQAEPLSVEVDWDLT